MAEQLAELNKGDLEVYSTTEKQVGVWIDGKPIYRKVIETTAPSTGNATFPSTSNPKEESIGANIDQIISLKGYVNFYNNLNFANINTANSDVEWLTVTARGNNATTPNTLRLTCGTSWVNIPVKIIVEYTKV